MERLSQEEIGISVNALVSYRKGVLEGEIWNTARWTDAPRKRVLKQVDVTVALIKKKLHAGAPLGKDERELVTDALIFSDQGDDILMPIEEKLALPWSSVIV
jgi:hypothetical protein